MIGGEWMYEDSLVGLRFRIGVLLGAIRKGDGWQLDDGARLR